MSDLMVAGPLGDMALGDPNAKNVIIEYASMTCLRQRWRRHLSAAQSEIHRHRQGLFHFPRFPARPAGDLGDHGRALRADAFSAR
jgi:hypothetical protein